MNDTIIQLSRISPMLRTLAALGLALAALPGQAGSAVERQLEAAATSAPHQRLKPAARPVMVHYVHLKDDYQTSSTAQALLRQLKHAVGACVEAKRRLGRPANPPAAFPDQFQHAHAFDYSAPNRSITYVISYNVHMDADCSLIERTRLSARLHSSVGRCEIDLDNKTAEGDCDATGHAGAPVRPRPDAARQAAGMAAMAADPLMAKHMATLRQLPGVNPAGAAANAPRRTIAGFECRMIEGLPGERSCVTQAGSFVPAMGAGLGMPLYREFVTYTMTAVEAKFDLPLDPAIFTPYQGGGYTITGKGGK